MTCPNDVPTNLMEAEKSLLLAKPVAGKVSSGRFSLSMASRVFGVDDGVGSGVASFLQK